MRIQTVANARLRFSRRFHVPPGQTTRASDALPARRKQNQARQFIVAWATIMGGLGSFVATSNDAPAPSQRPAAARSDARPDVRKDNSWTNDMVWIRGGAFWMGSTGANPDEQPLHEVTVNGFWMDKTEVTNEQFEKFARATGFVTMAERKPEFTSAGLMPRPAPNGRANDCRPRPNGNAPRAVVWTENRTSGAKSKPRTANGGPTSGKGVFPAKTPKRTVSVAPRQSPGSARKLRPGRTGRSEKSPARRLLLVQRCLLHRLPAQRSNEIVARHGPVTHRFSVCQRRAVTRELTGSRFISWTVWKNCPADFPWPL